MRITDAPLTTNINDSGGPPGLQAEAQTLLGKSAPGKPQGGPDSIPATFDRDGSVTFLASNDGASRNPTVQSVDNHHFPENGPDPGQPGNDGPITSPAQLGLSDYVPPGTPARQQTDAALDQLNKGLPNGDFKNTVLPDLQALGLDNVDIWYGSQVRMDGAGGQPPDNGALYDKWSKLPGAKPRTSSHPTNGKQQYEIPTGDGNSVILFGEDPQGNTFFQLEHDGATSDPAAHGRDYQLYLATHQQVGAKGISPHTDQDPIRLGWKK